MIKKYFYPLILLFIFAGPLPRTLGANGFMPEKDTVSVRDTCLASFQYYHIPDEPLQIKFIDNSLGNISAWHWDFGDGTYSNWQNPLHIFPEEGTYDVCLTVTDFFSGCMDTYCEPVYVGSQSQFYAFFDFYENPADPFNYQFIDLSKGSIVTWQWNFGDGQLSYANNPEHTYNGPGEYNVCLSVENQQGNVWDYYCNTIYVETVPDCRADFDYLQHPVNPLIFHFQNTSVGDYDFWIWDFGDGTISYETAPTHTYEEKGIYLVCLEIVDWYGNFQCYDMYCVEINATGSSPCHAGFNFEPVPPDALSIQFNNLSQGDLGFRFWDFGDGQTSYDNNPLHTYAQEGTYSAALIIVNNVSGCYDSIRQPVEVLQMPGCEALFAFDYIMNDSMSVQFTDLSLGINSAWLWDFGDGNTSTLQNPLHTYSSEEHFNVCLTVSSIWGPCQDTFCDTVVIDVSPVCQAHFEFEQNPDDVLEFSFFDTSSGDIESWLWDFGDGTTSDLQNPVHLYTYDGPFEVCLTVYDDWGPCEDTFCDSIFIDIPQLCIADFEIVNEGDNPFEYVFTDVSAGSINAWEWDFGDGSASDEQNPAHIFADTGNYEVCLTVYNTDSILFCNSTICYNLTVTVPSPSCQAVFQSEVDLRPNKPNLYHFTDLSQGTPDDWLWDFGDGNFSDLQHPSHQYSDSGTYIVSLKITTVNPWGEDCQDTEIQQINTPQYFDFGGMVFAGDFPINNPEHTYDTARVCLFKKVNSDLIPLDTSHFTQNGYYYYLNMLQGDYVIKFNLTEFSNNVMGYFPTYYGDKLVWDECQSLNISNSNNYAVNVHLYEMPETTNTGIGKIEGHVMMSASRFYGSGPQEDTEILLFDSNGDPVLYTYSVNDGSFIFEDLPLGTYTLIAESTGMLTDPYTVTLSNANPAIEGIELEIYENITSINESEIEKTNFRFYPNPVGETLHVLITGSADQNFHLRIYDLLGKLMYSEDIHSSSSSKLVNIPTNYLEPGVYLAEIVIFSRQEHFTFKLIKK
jgi:PKD repeat protein